MFDHTSFVTADSDYDFYQFNAVAGRTYVIETFNIQGTPRSRATGITLFNSSGNQIADDRFGNNGTGVTNARLVFTATSTDTYFVQVRRAEFTDWTGAYAIRVLPKYGEPGASWDTAALEPNDAIPLAYQLNVGAERALRGQIAPNNSLVSADADHDYYRFNAVAGVTYVIQTFNVEEDTSENGTGLYLYNATGSELANDRFGRAPGAIDAEITFTFATSGTYIVLVKDEEFSDWTGNYSLRVCVESCTQRVFLPMIRR